MQTKKTFVHPQHKGLVYRLYHRGDDMSVRWKIWWKDENGKRWSRYGDINRGETFTQRYAKATEVVRQLIDEHKNYQPISPIWPKVQAYIDRRRFGRKTKQEYAFRVKKLLNYIGGRDPSPRLVNQYLATLEKEVSGTTYNKSIDILRSCLREAGFEWIMADAKKLRARSQPHLYYQKNQRKQLTRYMVKHNAQLLLFCEFLFYSFIRPGELRLLKVGDILWDTMEIRVHGTVSKNKETEICVIPDCFAHTVEQYYYHKPTSEYLFPSPLRSDQPIGSNTMSRYHRKMLKELEYDSRHTMYSWRHTGAVTAIRSGIGIKELQLLMRHKDLATTDKYLRDLGIKDVRNFRSLMPRIDGLLPAHSVNHLSVR